MSRASARARSSGSARWCGWSSPYDPLSTRTPATALPAKVRRTRLRAAREEARVDLIQAISQTAETAQLAAALAAGRHAVATGGAGSSTHLLAGAIAAATGRPLVLVLAHLDDSDEATDELASAGIPATRLPGLEVLPGETHVSTELFAERLGAVR